MEYFSQSETAEIIEIYGGLTHIFRPIFSLTAHRELFGVELHPVLV